MSARAPTGTQVLAGWQLASSLNERASARASKRARESVQERVRERARKRESESERARERDGERVRARERDGERGQHTYGGGRANRRGRGLETGRATPAGKVGAPVLRIKLKHFKHPSILIKHKNQT